MALPPQPWEFRSKPAYQRLIIMLGGVTVNFILALLYIGMAFVYGDTYIANADMKDGLLIENQAMLNAGFKTGDKIISVDGTKIKKFDNDINMKVVLGKEILERNGTQETIKCLLILSINCLNLKRNLLDIRRPFVIGAVTDESTKDLQAKDVVVTLNGQAAKYIDQAKAILENNKGKTISATVLRDQKEKKPSYN
jgi:regulator of sigma E protease